jgi:hypothetical protein
MHQPCKAYATREKSIIDTKKKDSTTPYQEGKVRIVFIFGYTEATPYLLHRNNMARGKLGQQSE